MPNVFTLLTPSKKAQKVSSAPDTTYPIFFCLAISPSCPIYSWALEHLLMSVWQFLLLRCLQCATTAVFAPLVITLLIYFWKIASGYAITVLQNTCILLVITLF